MTKSHEREREGQASTWRGVAVVLVIIVGGCWMALSAATTQVVEDYRPDYQVERLSRDSLARSVTRLQHNSVDLELSWSTFGNERFGKGPYRLRILVRPKAPNFQALVFDSIRVESGVREYAFSDTLPWPLRIPRPERAWTDRYLDPAFDFDYNGGEVVETRLWYHIENTYDTLRHLEETTWVPVRIKRFVPIV